MLMMCPGEVYAYDQSSYRFFENMDSTDVGSPLAAEDTPATLGAANDVFRVRITVHVGLLTGLLLGGQDFKLQYAEKGTGSCASPQGSPSTYTDITSTTRIAYYDNPTPSDGDALTGNANDPSHGLHTTRNQTYEEQNTFSNSALSILLGQDGMWDFALHDYQAVGGATYCIRIAEDDGTALDSYVYPEITVPTSISYVIDNNQMDFGLINSTAVHTASPGITLTVSSNARNGYETYLSDTGNGSVAGLYSSSNGATIASSTATLAAGSEGYGVQASSSTATLSAQYDKSGNDVGALSRTPLLFCLSTDVVADEQTTVVGKSTVSNLTKAGLYSDVLTFSIFSKF